MIRNIKRVKYEERLISFPTETGFPVPISFVSQRVLLCRTSDHSLHDTVSHETLQITVFTSQSIEPQSKHQSGLGPQIGSRELEVSGPRVSDTTTLRDLRSFQYIYSFPPFHIRCPLLRVHREPLTRQERLWRRLLSSTTRRGRLSTVFVLSVQNKIES